MLELPYPPKELNPNEKAHYHKKGSVAKKYKSDCFYLAKTHAPLKAFRIEFHPAINRRRDIDNAIAAFKAGQDGLSLAWKIDDSEFEITYPKTFGEIVKPHGCVRIYGVEK